MKKTTEKKYQTCVEEVLNGTVILNLEPTAERYGLKLGSKKLSIILQNIEDVRLFLERNPYVPRVKIELTTEQKALWTKARKVLRTGLVDPIRIKQALVKAGISSSDADNLLDQEITSNRAKAESLLDL